MKALTDDAVKYIVARMLENATEAIKEAKEDDNEFTRGRKFAYYEMLDTIKNELEAHDQNLSDYGLEANLEQKML